MPKILIVDDEENNRAVIADALDGDEFQLDEAADGQAALRNAAVTSPDLILLDVLMPGMDGIETLRRLKSHEQTREIPVIMVTALNMDSQIAACLDEGAVDHIAKPFSNMVLRARLRTALRSKSGPLVDQAAPRQRGKVLVFVGAKGGVGTTTVALNVAAKLAQAGKGVTVCELRTDYGTAAAQLGTSPVLHLGRLVGENPERISRRELQKFLCKDPSGMRVLFGPQEAGGGIELTPDHARDILDALADQSEFTIVDLSHHPCELNDSALQAADYVVMVVELEPTSVAAADKMLNRFRSLGISDRSMGAVVNSRASTTSPPINLYDVRAGLDCDLIGAISPAPEAFAMAAKTGSPLVAFQPDCTAANALLALSNRLTAEHITTLPV